MVEEIKIKHVEPQFETEEFKVLAYRLILQRLALAPRATSEECLHFLSQYFQEHPERQQ